jgi:hypothetical protein
MISQLEVLEGARRLQPRAILSIAAEVGLVAPASSEMPQARDLAAELMRHEVVSVETLLAVQAVQPTATLVFKEDGRITGVSGQLLFRRSAIARLYAGVFDAVDVDTRLLSRPGEPPAAGYSWGIAASTKRAAAAVILFGKEVRARLYPNLVIFTRAVTPVGRHIATTRHGYRPLRGPDDDFMIRLPNPEARAA